MLYQVPEGSSTPGKSFCRYGKSMFWPFTLDQTMNRDYYALWCWWRPSWKMAPCANRTHFRRCHHAVSWPTHPMMIDFRHADKCWYSAAGTLIFLGPPLQHYIQCVPQKVTLLNVWLWQVQTCTTLHIIKRAQALMYFDYCHQILYKFFVHLADFLFLQNVKKCSYQQH